MRRQSSPADLRHSKLNRNTDLRDLTRSRRRASSVPPDLRKLREALISGLRNSMTQKEERVEEESDTSSSSSSDSNEEGEVEPSEDELTNVRYSESDTLIRTPNPALNPQKKNKGKNQNLVHQVPISTVPLRKARPKNRKSISHQ